MHSTQQELGFIARSVRGLWCFASLVHLFVLLLFAIDKIYVKDTVSFALIGILRGLRNQEWKNGTAVRNNAEESFSCRHAQLVAL
jgi:hypothetical protein